MGKSSVVTKEIRAEIQARKRRIHGDPSTRKLKIRTQPVAISGKRKRKLFKKWRRVCLVRLNFSLVFFSGHEYMMICILFLFQFIIAFNIIQDQKDKIEKGLITMQDVEMAVVQG